MELQSEEIERSGEHCTLVYRSPALSLAAMRRQNAERCYSQKRVTAEATTAATTVKMWLHQKAQDIKSGAPKTLLGSFCSAHSSRLSFQHLIEYCPFAKSRSADPITINFVHPLQTASHVKVNGRVIVR
eukprot:TRINITY_DN262_c3_g1_i2.p1 TRINITY_DN262_c3_g1~~TRINITY_DN262_c3_g1_i2.p1  ORF type:complete len:129 (-),score=26.52 TRINITY_DN262_c3_g1_i2:253-639(-)